MSTILVLTGPTASGKSEVCKVIAENLPCVIVNCDSKQIYSNIPTIVDQPAFLRNNPKFRLYGYVCPTECYSVYKWLVDAKQEICNIIKEGYIPIVTGGSGMYISSMIYGLSDIPTIDEDIRAQGRKLLETMGISEFYDMLLQMDQNVASINKNNTSKILRSYEVITQTGISIFDWQKHHPRKPVFENCKVHVLMPDRSTVYDCINRRFMAMVNSSALSEVEYLMSLSLSPYAPVMKVCGVQPLARYIAGQITLTEAIEIGMRDTRRYAKRQYTWFRTQLPSDALFFASKEQILSHFLSNIH